MSIPEIELAKEFEALSKKRISDLATAEKENTPSLQNRKKFNAHLKFYKDLIGLIDQIIIDLGTIESDREIIKPYASLIKQINSEFSRLKGARAIALKQQRNLALPKLKEAINSLKEKLSDIRELEDIEKEIEDREKSDLPSSLLKPESLSEKKEEKEVKEHLAAIVFDEDDLEDDTEQETVTIHTPTKSSSSTLGDKKQPILSSNPDVAREEELTQALNAFAGSKGSAETEQAVIDILNSYPKELLSEILNKRVGITPLGYAVQYNSLALVKKLIELGAKVTTHADREKLPLHMAAEFRPLPGISEEERRLENNINRQIVSELIKADRSKKTINAHAKGSGGGDTPLVLASGAGNVGAMEVLLKSGARADIVTILSPAIENKEKRQLEGTVFNITYWQVNSLWKSDDRLEAIAELLILPSEKLALSPAEHENYIKQFFSEAPESLIAKYGDVLIQKTGEKYSEQELKDRDSKDRKDSDKASKPGFFDSVRSKISSKPKNPLRTKLEAAKVAKPYTATTRELVSKLPKEEQQTNIVRLIEILGVELDNLEPIDISKSQQALENALKIMGVNEQHPIFESMFSLLRSGDLTIRNNNKRGLIELLITGPFQQVNQLKCALYGTEGEKERVFKKFNEAVLKSNLGKHAELIKKEVVGYMTSHFPCLASILPEAWKILTTDESLIDSLKGCDTQLKVDELLSKIAPNGQYENIYNQLKELNHKTEQTIFSYLKDEWLYTPLEKNGANLENIRRIAGAIEAARSIRDALERGYALEEKKEKKEEKKSEGSREEPHIPLMTAESSVPSGSRSRRQMKFDPTLATKIKGATVSSSSLEEPPPPAPPLPPLNSSSSSGLSSSSSESPPPLILPSSRSRPAPIKTSKEEVRSEPSSPLSDSEDEEKDSKRKKPDIKAEKKEDKLPAEEKKKKQEETIPQLQALLKAFNDYSDIGKPGKKPIPSLILALEPLLKNISPEELNKIKPSLLKVALDHNFLDIVELFLKYGADPTLTDNEGYNSLHYAISIYLDLKGKEEDIVAYNKQMENHARILELLIKRGKELSAKKEEFLNIQTTRSDARYSPLILAIENGDFIALKIVLDNNANPFQQSLNLKPFECLLATQESLWDVNDKHRAIAELLLHEDIEKLTEEQIKKRNEEIDKWFEDPEFNKKNERIGGGATDLAISEYGRRLDELQGKYKAKLGIIEEKKIEPITPFITQIKRPEKLIRQLRIQECEKLRTAGYSKEGIAFTGSSMILKDYDSLLTRYYKGGTIADPAERADLLHALVIINDYDAIRKNFEKDNIGKIVRNFPDNLTNAKSTSRNIYLTILNDLIHSSSPKKTLDVLEFLIDREFDINIPVNNLNILESYLIYKYKNPKPKNPEVVKFLISNGARITKGKAGEKNAFDVLLEDLLTTTTKVGISLEAIIETYNQNVEILRILIDCGFRPSSVELNSKLIEIRTQLRSYYKDLKPDPRNPASLDQESYEKFKIISKSLKTLIDNTKSEEKKSEPGLGVSSSTSSSPASKPKSSIRSKSALKEEYGIFLVFEKEYKAISESKGIPLNVKDHQGENLLHKAVRMADNKRLTYILDLKSFSKRDILAVNDKGDNILHIAIKSKSSNPEFFEFLIKSIQTKLSKEEFLNLINQRDKEGNSLLHNALIYKRDGIFNHLITTATNIEALDSSERTPLLLAAELGRSDLVSKLLVRGSNILAHDLEGRNILNITLSKGHKPIEGVFDAFVSALQAGKPITQLNLVGAKVDGEPINDNDIISLLKAAKTNKHLKIIKLGGEISDRVAYALSDLITTPGCSIERIDLSKAKFKTSRESTIITHRPIASLSSSSGSAVRISGNPAKVISMAIEKNPLVKVISSESQISKAAKTHKAKTPHKKYNPGDIELMYLAAKDFIDSHEDRKEKKRSPVSDKIEMEESLTVKPASKWEEKLFKDFISYLNKPDFSADLLLKRSVKVIDKSSGTPKIIKAGTIEKVFNSESGTGTFYSATDKFRKDLTTKLISLPIEQQARKLLELMAATVNEDLESRRFIFRLLLIANTPSEDINNPPHLNPKLYQAALPYLQKDYQEDFEQQISFLEKSLQHSKVKESKARRSIFSTLTSFISRPEPSISEDDRKSATIENKKEESKAPIKYDPDNFENYLVAAVRYATKEDQNFTYAETKSGEVRLAEKQIAVFLDSARESKDSETISGKSGFQHMTERFVRFIENPENIEAVRKRVTAGAIEPGKWLTQTGNKKTGHGITQEVFLNSTIKDGEGGERQWPFSAVARGTILQKGTTYRLTIAQEPKNIDQNRLSYFSKHISSIVTDTFTRQTKDENSEARQMVVCQMQEMIALAIMSEPNPKVRAVKELEAYKLLLVANSNFSLHYSTKLYERALSTIITDPSQIKDFTDLVGQLRDFNSKMGDIQEEGVEYKAQKTKREQQEEEEKKAFEPTIAGEPKPLWVPINNEDTPHLKLYKLRAILGANGLDNQFKLENLQKVLPEFASFITAEAMVGKIQNAPQITEAFKTIGINDKSVVTEALIKILGDGPRIALYNKSDQAAKDIISFVSSYVKEILPGKNIPKDIPISSYPGGLNEYIQRKLKDVKEQPVAVLAPEPTEDEKKEQAQEAYRADRRKAFAAFRKYYVPDPKKLPIPKIGERYSIAQTVFLLVRHSGKQIPAFFSTNEEIAKDKGFITKLKDATNKLSTKTKTQTVDFDEPKVIPLYLRPNPTLADSLFLVMQEYTVTPDFLREENNAFYDLQNFIALYAKDEEEAFELLTKINSSPDNFRNFDDYQKAQLIPEKAAKEFNEKITALKAQVAKNDILRKEIAPIWTQAKEYYEGGNREFIKYINFLAQASKGECIYNDANAAKIEIERRTKSKPLPKERLDFLNGYDGLFHLQSLDHIINYARDNETPNIDGLLNYLNGKPLTPIEEQKGKKEKKVPKIEEEEQEADVDDPKIEEKEEDKNQDNKGEDNKNPEAKIPDDEYEEVDAELEAEKDNNEEQDKEGEKEGEDEDKGEGVPEKKGDKENNQDGNEDKKDHKEKDDDQKDKKDPEPPPPPPDPDLPARIDRVIAALQEIENFHGNPHLDAIIAAIRANAGFAAVRNAFADAGNNHALKLIAQQDRNGDLGANFIRDLIATGGGDRFSAQITPEANAIINNLAALEGTVRSLEAIRDAGLAARNQAIAAAAAALAAAELQARRQQVRQILEQIRVFGNIPNNLAGATAYAAIQGAMAGVPDFGALRAAIAVGAGAGAPNPLETSAASEINNGLFARAIINSEPESQNIDRVIDAIAATPALVNALTAVEAAGRVPYQARVDRIPQAQRGDIAGYLNRQSQRIQMLQRIHNALHTAFKDGGPGGDNPHGRLAIYKAMVAAIEEANPGELAVLRARIAAEEAVADEPGGAALRGAATNEQFIRAIIDINPVNRNAIAAAIAAIDPPVDLNILAPGLTAGQKVLHNRAAIAHLTTLQALRVQPLATRAAIEAEVIRSIPNLLPIKRAFRDMGVVFNYDDTQNFFHVLIDNQDPEQQAKLIAAITTRGYDRAVAGELANAATIGTRVATNAVAVSEQINNLRVVRNTHDVFLERIAGQMVAAAPAPALVALHAALTGVPSIRNLFGADADNPDATFAQRLMNINPAHQARIVGFLAGMDGAAGAQARAALQAVLDAARDEVAVIRREEALIAIINPIRALRVPTDITAPVEAANNQDKAARRAALYSAMLRSSEDGLGLGGFNINFTALLDRIHSAPAGHPLRDLLHAAPAYTVGGAHLQPVFNFAAPAPAPAHFYDYSQFFDRLAALDPDNNDADRLLIGHLVRDPAVAGNIAAILTTIRDAGQAVNPRIAPLQAHLRRFTGPTPHDGVIQGALATLITRRLQPPHANNDFDALQGAFAGHLNTVDGTAPGPAFLSGDLGQFITSLTGDIIANPALNGRVLSALTLALDAQRTAFQAVSQIAHDTRARITGIRGHLQTIRGFATYVAAGLPAPPAEITPEIRGAIIAAMVANRADPAQNFSVLRTALRAFRDANAANFALLASNPATQAIRDAIAGNEDGGDGDIAANQALAQALIGAGAPPYTANPNVLAIISSLPDNARQALLDARTAGARVHARAAEINQITGQLRTFNASNVYIGGIGANPNGGAILSSIIYPNLNPPSALAQIAEANASFMHLVTAIANRDGAGGPDHNHNLVVAARAIVNAGVGVTHEQKAVFATELIRFNPVANQDVTYGILAAIASSPLTLAQLTAISNRATRTYNEAANVIAELGRLRAMHQMYAGAANAATRQAIENAMIGAANFELLRVAIANCGATNAGENGSAALVAAAAAAPPGGDDQRRAFARALINYAVDNHADGSDRIIAAIASYQANHNALTAVAQAARGAINTQIEADFTALHALRAAPTAGTPDQDRTRAAMDFAVGAIANLDNLRAVISAIPDIAGVGSARLRETAAPPNNDNQRRAFARALIEYNPAAAGADRDAIRDAIYNAGHAQIDTLRLAKTTAQAVSTHAPLIQTQLHRLSRLQGTPHVRTAIEEMIRNPDGTGFNRITAVLDGADNHQGVAELLINNLLNHDDPVVTMQSIALIAQNDGVAVPTLTQILQTVSATAINTANVLGHLSTLHAARADAPAGSPQRAAMVRAMRASPGWARIQAAGAEIIATLGLVGGATADQIADAFANYLINTDLANDGSDPSVAFRIALTAAGADALRAALLSVRTAGCDLVGYTQPEVDEIVRPVIARNRALAGPEAAKLASFNAVPVDGIAVRDLLTASAEVLADKGPADKVFLADDTFPDVTAIKEREKRQLKAEDKFRPFYKTPDPPASHREDFLRTQLNSEEPLAKRRELAAKRLANFATIMARKIPTTLPEGQQRKERVYELLSYAYSRISSPPDVDPHEHPALSLLVTPPPIPVPLEADDPNYRAHLDTRVWRSIERYLGLTPGSEEAEVSKSLIDDLVSAKKEYLEKARATEPTLLAKSSFVESNDVVDQLMEDEELVKALLAMDGDQLEGFIVGGEKPGTFKEYNLAIQNFYSNLQRWTGLRRPTVNSSGIVIFPSDAQKQAYKKALVKAALHRSLGGVLRPLNFNEELPTNGTPHIIPSTTIFHAKSIPTIAAYIKGHTPLLTHDHSTGASSFESGLTTSLNNEEISWNKSRKEQDQSDSKAAQEHTKYYDVEKFEHKDMTLKRLRDHVREKEFQEDESAIISISDKVKIGNDKEPRTEIVYKVKADNGEIHTTTITAEKEFSEAHKGEISTMLKKGHQISKAIAKQGIEDSVIRQMVDSQTQNWGQTAWKGKRHLTPFSMTSDKGKAHKVGAFVAGGIGNIVALGSGLGLVYAGYKAADAIIEEPASLTWRNRPALVKTIFKDFIIDGPPAAPASFSPLNISKRFGNHQVKVLIRTPKDLSKLTKGFRNVQYIAVDEDPNLVIKIEFALTDKAVKQIVVEDEETYNGVKYKKGDIIEKTYKKGEIIRHTIPYERQKGSNLPKQVKLDKDGKPILTGTQISRIKQMQIALYHEEYDEQEKSITLKEVGMYFRGVSSSTTQVTNYQVKPDELQSEQTPFDLTAKQAAKKAEDQTRTGQTEVIDMSGATVKASAVESIRKLIRLGKAKEINLRDANISQAELEKIIATMIENPGVEILRLGGQKLTVNTQRLLAKAIEKSGGKLTELDLNGVTFDNSGALEDVVAFARDKVKTLRLGVSSNVTDPHVTSIINHLQHNDNIVETLELQVKYPPDSGLNDVQNIDIINGLDNASCKVTTLKLSGEIGNQMTIRLTTLLQVPNGKIKKLDLSGAKIKKGELLIIIQSIGINRYSKLSELNLSGIRIVDDTGSEVGLTQDLVNELAAMVQREHNQINVINLDGVKIASGVDISPFKFALQGTPDGPPPAIDRCKVLKITAHSKCDRDFSRALQIRKEADQALPGGTILNQLDEGRSIISLSGLGGSLAGAVLTKYKYTNIVFEKLEKNLKAGKIQSIDLTGIADRNPAGPINPHQLSNLEKALAIVAKNNKGITKFKLSGTAFPAIGGLAANATNATTELREYLTRTRDLTDLDLSNNTSAAPYGAFAAIFNAIAGNPQQKIKTLNLNNTALQDADVEGFIAFVRQPANLNCKLEHLDIGKAAGQPDSITAADIVGILNAISGNEASTIRSISLQNITVTPEIAAALSGLIATGRLESLDLTGATITDANLVVMLGAADTTAIIAGSKLKTLNLDSANIAITVPTDNNSGAERLSLIASSTPLKTLRLPPAMNQVQKEFIDKILGFKTALKTGDPVKLSTFLKNNFDNATSGFIATNIVQLAQVFAKNPSGKLDLSGINEAEIPADKQEFMRVFRDMLRFTKDVEAGKPIKLHDYVRGDPQYNNHNLATIRQLFGNLFKSKLAEITDLDLSDCTEIELAAIGIGSEAFGGRRRVRIEDITAHILGERAGQKLAPKLESLKLPADTWINPYVTPPTETQQFITALRASKIKKLDMSLAIIGTAAATPEGFATDFANEGRLDIYNALAATTPPTPTAQIESVILNTRQAGLLCFEQLIRVPTCPIKSITLTGGDDTLGAVNGYNYGNISPSVQLLQALVEAGNNSKVTSLTFGAGYQINDTKTAQIIAAMRDMGCRLTEFDFGDATVNHHDRVVEIIEQGIRTNGNLHLTKIKLPPFTHTLANDNHVRVMSALLSRVPGEVNLERVTIPAGGLAEIVNAATAGDARIVATSLTLGEHVTVDAMDTRALATLMTTPTLTHFDFRRVNVSHDHGVSLAAAIKARADAASAQVPVPKMKFLALGQHTVPTLDLGATLAKLVEKDNLEKLDLRGMILDSVTHKDFIDKLEAGLKKKGGSSCEIIVDDPLIQANLNLAKKKSPAPSPSHPAGAHGLTGGTGATLPAPIVPTT